MAEWLQNNKIWCETLEVKQFLSLSTSDPSILLSHGSFEFKWLDCFCATICLFVYPFQQSPRSFFVYFTAMHLFGLNWQLQELDNQPAFENGGVGKTGPTQSSIVTALAADGEEIKSSYLIKSLLNI